MNGNVITGCYSSALVIRHTFESVAAGTYLNIENIVVDGNCSDGTHEILRRDWAGVEKFLSEPDRSSYFRYSSGWRRVLGDNVRAVLNSVAR